MGSEWLTKVSLKVLSLKIEIITMLDVTYVLVLIPMLISREEVLDGGQTPS